jgi:hypothetical protein
MPFFMGWAKSIKRALPKAAKSIPKASAALIVEFFSCRS